MEDSLRAGKSFRYVTSHPGHLNLVTPIAAILIQLIKGASRLI